MSTPIRVIGLPGSLRDVSYTRMAVDVALQGAEEAGATTQMIDLREFELPFCDGNQDESAYPADVFRFRDEIKQAHGVILGTPEYHAGMSGVLKNALDLTGFDEFEGKMIGLVGVAGGVLGASHALDSLRAVGRSLHAWVIPEQVTIPRVWQIFEKDGTPKDGRIARRLHTVGERVAHFASIHAAGEDPEFLRLWQSAPENPGGGKSPE
jgi:FMN reductase